MPRREEVMLIEVSFALKLLDVNDQMCAGGAAVIADRQDLTRLREAVDAQIVELGNEVRQSIDSVLGGLGAAESVESALVQLHVVEGHAGAVRQQGLHLVDDLLQVLIDILVALI